MRGLKAGSLYNIKNHLLLIDVSSMYVGAAVEREAHQDAKPLCPEGAEGFSLLGLTPSWFTPVTLFDPCTRLIGAGRGSSYQSYVALAAHESRPPSQIPVPLTMASQNQK